MSDSVQWLRHLNDLARRQLDASYEQVAARHSEAERILEECSEEFERIEAQRINLDEVEKIHLSLIENQEPTVVTGTFGPPASIETPERKRRARLGPQRYLIFAILSLMGSASEEHICHTTKLQGKRVREQLKSDISEGLIKIVPSNSDDNPFVNYYDLTEDGRDLLERFEAYKKLKDEDLPTIEDIKEDGHEDEDDSLTSASASDRNSQTEAPL